MSAEVEKTDLDVILPRNLMVVAVDGKLAYVSRMKMRHVALLARGLYQAYGDKFADIKLDPKSDTFSKEVLGLLIVALPELVEAVVPMTAELLIPVEPADLEAIREAAQDPSPTLLVDVLSVVIEQEGDELAVLVGKVQTLTTTLSALAKKNVTNGQPAPSLGRKRST